jgi:NAD+ synthase (glutamine-hydrolysing)
LKCTSKCYNNDMSNKILPITALRDTAKIDEEIHKSSDPIFVTKNGYGDFVLVSQEYFDSHFLTPTKAPNHEKTQPFVLNTVPQDDPFGFVRCSCVSIETSVCGVAHNVDEIKKAVDSASKQGVKVLVFSELTLTGYTAGDLFLSSTLQEKVVKALLDLAQFSSAYDLFFIVGAPLIQSNCLYNCAVCIHQGKILGVNPKTNLPNYAEFYEKRYFHSAPAENGTIQIGDQSYPFGSRIIYVDERYPSLKIGVEICEDAWVPDSPSINHALMGATVLANLSASNEVVGKKEFRSSLVSMASAKLIAAYLYADAGNGESTSDLVFAGHNLIAENGKILSESPLFKQQAAIADIDLERLQAERVKTTSFGNGQFEGYRYLPFAMKLEKPLHVLRHYSMNPFIPEQKEVDLNRVQSIMAMQAMGLVKRLETVHQQKVIVGESGGLDSTLALLVAVEAFKYLHYDLKGITALTMPAFGTSKRTHDNAKLLAKSLGVSFQEINIKDTLLSHLKDINHSPDDHNVTYENAQARERTQVLMDLANDTNSLMIGTGDLSELCLGWCTYNGDHMSMYGVNGSIPKTLVRYLCQGYALLHPEAAKPLNDIIDTPISPELLPTDQKGQIAQKTEDKIGPYELHDFFIYHFLRFGFRPKKLYFLAQEAYHGKYDDATIKKWLGVFLKRFFQNEFKRSCLPDGAKVGTVAISPRGDLRMPSDASVEDYLKDWNDL